MSLPLPFHSRLKIYKVGIGASAGPRSSPPRQLFKCFVSRSPAELTEISSQTPANLPGTARVVGAERLQPPNDFHACNLHTPSSPGPPPRGGRAAVFRKFYKLEDNRHQGRAGPGTEPSCSSARTGQLTARLAGAGSVSPPSAPIFIITQLF